MTPEAKAELDAFFISKGWEVVPTAQTEFHNYRKARPLGDGNYASLSVMLKPNVMDDYLSHYHLYMAVGQSMRENR